ncbi:hypothetical protein V8C86DRAFT_3092697 [Haematococcus lacustris]
MSHLATCSTLVLHLDRPVSRFLNPEVLAVLRARTQPLQLHLQWNVEGPQYSIPDILRFVIGLLRGCTAVHEVVLDGDFSEAELGAWLGATIADSFPELSSLTLRCGMGYEGLARLMSDPALQSLALHLDLSQAIVYGPGAAAFFRAAASLESLHMDFMDSLGEFLHDMPCNWRSLRVGQADMLALSRLPLHAVKEEVHIACLKVVASADNLDAITAAAPCFAVGVPVRPKVDRLHVDIFGTTDEELAVLATLQPLSGCTRVVDVVGGDYSAVEVDVFDADVMEALLPVCQGCSELRIRRATLQLSPKVWHAIVDGVPSISRVHIHQCFECDEHVLGSLQEYVEEHGGRGIDIQVDFFLQSPLGSHEDLRAHDLSLFHFGPLRVCVEEMDWDNNPFDGV